MTIDNIKWEIDTDKVIKRLVFGIQIWSTKSLHQGMIIQFFVWSPFFGSISVTCSSLLADLAMSATADIAGVSREWEDVHTLRQQVWQHGNLFRDHNAADSPSINVKTAIMNFDALLPLVKHLGTPDGDVLMTTIPDLKKEFLRLIWKSFNCFTCFHHLRQFVGTKAAQS